MLAILLSACVLISDAEVTLKVGVGADDEGDTDTAVVSISDADGDGFTVGRRDLLRLLQFGHRWLCCR